MYINKIFMDLQMDNVIGNRRWFKKEKFGERP